MIDPARLTQLEQANGLPQGLLSAVMQQESGGNPNAVSPKGATGAFQFMPATAQQYGINPRDPDQSAMGAAKMFGDLSRKYNGDLPSMLAGYNWGQGNVDRQGLANAPPETRDYIANISSKLNPTQTTAYQQTFSGGNLKSAAMVTPELPPGFVLDPPASSGLPPGFVLDPPASSGLPPGFVLDQPQQAADTATSMGSQHQTMLANANAAMTGPNAPALGIPATLTGYAANAMQAIPFADEAGSAIAATLGAGQGKDWGSRYTNLQQSQQAMREAGKANNPDTTTVGQIGAGLATIPFMPGPSKVAKSLGGALVQGAATGAKYGAAYGLGDTNSFLPTPQASVQRLGNAARGVEWGAGTGAPLGGLGYAIAPKAQAFTAAETRTQASAAYDQADKLGGTLIPNFTNRFITEISKITPQTGPGKLVSGENEVTKLLDRLTDTKNGIVNTPLSLKAAQEIDSGLGDLIDKTADRTTGKLSNEGRQLYQVQTKFRDMIQNAGAADILGGRQGFDAWNQARQLWAKQAKMGDIERVISNGELMDNPAQSIRSGFRTLLKNPARMKAYGPAETTLIKQAANANMTQEALRTLGARLTQLVSLGTGHLVGAAVGHGVGAASRAVAGGLQSAAGQRVLDQISRGPNAAMPQIIPALGGVARGVSRTRSQ